MGELLEYWRGSRDPRPGWRGELAWSFAMGIMLGAFIVSMIALFFDAGEYGHSADVCMVMGFSIPLSAVGAALLVGMMEIRVRWFKSGFQPLNPMVALVFGMTEVPLIMFGEATTRRTDLYFAALIAVVLLVPAIAAKVLIRSGLPTPILPPARPETGTNPLPVISIDERRQIPDSDGTTENTERTENAQKGGPG